MRGYCGTCQEYRSDDGTDAWRIEWQGGVGVCARCGHVVDLWNNGGSGGLSPVMYDGDVADSSDE